MRRPKNIEVVRLFDSITNKLYVARNITLDESIIIDCIVDLCKVSNRFNDHNGMASEREIVKQSNRVLNELIEKYK